MKKEKNPILKGFYPDPSICRVGIDYYLVNSTFTYFPGVPIFHSRDLVHWNQIGNVLDRESQLPLQEGNHSMGIFAPTLRYHGGIFYMITTNVCNGGNFVVTSTDPAGPWSDPYWLDAEGIDPSLFFDDDGRCYYCGTKDRREGPKYYGDNEIYVQELDLKSMKLIGESYPIWHGALKEVAWPEGPHIYKREGWYYLLISEAGTGHEHAVSIARSNNIFAEFTGNPNNPILTHRHLGLNYPIVNVGHPDIIETQNNEWWMVLLASRPYGGYYRNLGRETFLVPFTWENQWPVINPGVGKVEEEFEAPNLPYYEPLMIDEKEDFKSEALPFHFLYLRNPDKLKYSLNERHDYLRIYASTHKLFELKSPSFVGRRQQSMRYTTKTKLEFSPKTGDCAGLCIIQSNAYYYSFYITLVHNDIFARVCRCEDGRENIIESRLLTKNSSGYELKIHANYQELSFSVKNISGEFESVCENVDGRILSTDVAGGFVGTCIGIFATTESSKSTCYADFDWFSLVD